MPRLNSLLPLFVVIVIVGFFIWGLLPRDDYGKKVFETLQQEKQKADVVLDDATLAEVVNGVKYWELLAKTSSMNNTTGKADLTKVDGLFFDSGTPTLKFLAPTAVWNMRGNEIFLQDPIGYDIRSETSVKEMIAKEQAASNGISRFHLSTRNTGRSFEGYWFEAKNLEWKLSTKKLLCNGSISLTKGNVVINAEHLDADVGLQMVRLTGAPSAEIVTDGGSITMNADEFLVDSTKDVMIANRNVVIKKSGSVINADRSTYSQKDNSVALSGSVKLADGEIVANSNSANYNLTARAVTLTDNARARRGQSEISGEKMTVLLGQNRIIVEGRTKAQIKGTDIK